MKKKTIWDMNRLTAEQFKSAPKIPLVVVLDNVRSRYSARATLSPSSG